MDRTPEERFVNSFIRKERRRRLLFELGSPQKRRDAVDRFCHQAEELLDPAKIALRGEDLERRAEFRAFLRQREGPCLMLSPAFPEGRTLPLSRAVEEALLFPDAAVIAGDGFAVVFGEPMPGGRGKYLLAEKERP